MSSSTIPKVLDATEDLLGEAAAGQGARGADIQVTQGPPQSPERERFEIAEVGPAPQEWATLGGLVDERYSVTCWVLVDDPTHQTVRDCKNRAFELLGYAETALRADNQFGLVGSYQYFEARFGGVTSARAAASADGWIYEIQFAVMVAAII